MTDTFTDVRIHTKPSAMQILYVGRNTEVNSLAGSIAHALRQDGSVAVQAIGANAVNQMVKSLTVARYYLQNEGKELVTQPEMVDVNISGAVITAIRMGVHLVEPRPCQ